MVMEVVSVLFKGGPLDGQKWALRSEEAQPQIEIPVLGAWPLEPDKPVTIRRAIYMRQSRDPVSGLTVYHFEEYR